MTFELGQYIFPLYSEKPVKCLGKYFDDNRNTTNILEHIVDEIDKSGQPGKKTPWYISIDGVAFADLRYTIVQGGS